MLNGLLNMYSSINICGFNQPHKGTNRKDYAAHLTDVVDYLLEEGYDLGYCDSNIHRNIK